MAGGGIEIRDSKDPDGPILQFNGTAWAGFRRSPRQGRSSMAGI
ncbi:DUF397 domain-containing protein [Saccharopolyspora sp. NPDC050389]